MGTAPEKGARGADYLGLMIKDVFCSSEIGCFSSGADIGSLKEVVKGSYDPSEHIAHVCHWTLLGY